MAFDLAVGNHGSAERVRHFIGEQDYGVIVDEYLAQRTVAFSWRKGGFLRSAPFQAQVTVRREGEERHETAILSGTLFFETLTTVEFVTDSNTRGDYLNVGGRATPGNLSLQFHDGSFADPNELPAWGPRDWAVMTKVSPLSEPHPYPPLRPLQLRIGLDGHRRLACPFAHAPAAPAPLTVVATVLNAVQKRALFLGNIDQVLR